jgi:hypothetical protein
MNPHWRALGQSIVSFFINPCWIQSRISPCCISPYIHTYIHLLASVCSRGEAFPAILTQKGHARTHPQHDARNLCGEWNRDHDPKQSTGLGPGVLLADDAVNHLYKHTISLSTHDRRGVCQRYEFMSASIHCRECCNLQLQTNLHMHQQPSMFPLHVS